ncbi:hypothetical protein BGW41_000377, partial [Actinomortierella wolfii]
TKGGCRKHLANLVCVPEEQDYDETVEQTPAITMPSHQSLPIPTRGDSTPQMRDYNDTVLYSDIEKRRTLNIIDALELRPFAMKDSDGAEQNGLAHVSVIVKLSAGQGQIAPNMPLPKKGSLLITIPAPIAFQLRHLDW